MVGCLVTACEGVQRSNPATTTMYLRPATLFPLPRLGPPKLQPHGLWRLLPLL
jgi:hypothetical protein